MRLCKWLVILCGVMPVMALAAEDIVVKVDGIAGEAKSNLEAYVGTVSSDDLQNWSETRRRLRKSCREAMEAVGYYQSDIEIVPQDKTILIHVKANQPVVVRHLSLKYDGDASNDPAFTALREVLPVHEGEIFHHGRYENLKTQIQNMALERGYFSAKWDVSHVDVIIPEQGKTDNPVADINLIYNSGLRYHFGKVDFANTNKAADLPLQMHWLQTLTPFSEGDPYQASKIIEFNKNLLDSRYFNDVRVRADPVDEDHEVPVDVALTASKLNQLDVGAGYATDLGARASTAWRRPLLNERGHGVEITSEISQVRQTIDTRYTIPWLHPTKDTIQFFAGFKREVVDDTTTTFNTTLGVERQVRNKEGWQRTLSLRFSREAYEKVNGETGNSDLLLPGFSLNRTRSKGGTDPTYGDRQYYQIEAASPYLLSTADLISLRAGWRLLRTYADRHQMLLRADVGGILSNDFDSVPINMRFYAGGDQSVRGYDYQSLAPKDTDGTVIGGRELLVLSSEYAFRLTNRWRLATFVDAGNAFDSPREGLKTGVGVGVRWVSPVGPVRLDVAYGLDNEHPTPRIHFFMGPAL